MQGGGGWGPPRFGGPPPGQPPPAGGYGQPPHAPRAFGPSFDPIPARQAVPGYTPGRCPHCNGDELKRPTFTWWGGYIGPRLLNHVVCNACGFGFNAKTGKDNSILVGIHLGLVAALAVILTLLLQSFAR